MFSVGIIGCGDISQDHYEGFRDTGRAAVNYVFDTDPGSARGKAREWKARVMP